MNQNSNRYSQFALCREMMETSDVIRCFKVDEVRPIADILGQPSQLMLTGEGSSRIFPAKRAIAESLRMGNAMIPVTEGATQAAEYKLDKFGVLGLSNSGKTRELIRLFKALKHSAHTALGGVTAGQDTPLQDAAHQTFVLNCGAEQAVAATKSVVEQALVVQAVVSLISGRKDGVSDGCYANCADAFKTALELSVPAEFAQAMASADTVYFAGRNDGVAEELTLKANEIMRKKADFLEGTYAAHGIEEVLSKDDVLILVDPFVHEEQKLQECLVDGVGISIFAVSDRPTTFPTLQVPDVGPWRDYIMLAAGWNLLVEAGLELGINLDKTMRARKVGNEFKGD